jgi:cell division protein FtsZ
MTLNIQLPENAVMKPKITVFGVGGAGGNATNNMIAENLEGADFVVANTDAQALASSLSDKRIQLGQVTTQGLGAGASPDVGRKAAEEAMPEIVDYLKNSNMVFITAGMGGGTGTGAAPVIARAAREHGILTVGVVTKPFHFEGPRRMRLAEEGLKDLQKYVDTLIIIPNQNLFRIANEKTTFADAFKLADDVLYSGVRGITDLMVMPGLINLDFADVKAVMSEMGKAMMGTGEAEGERRALEAAESAISNPLLDNVSMKGARGVLINITGGSDMTLFEVDEAANRVREEVDPDANIIFGSTFNSQLEGKIRVSVVATGIDAPSVTRSYYSSASENIAESEGEAAAQAEDIYEKIEEEVEELDEEINAEAYANAVRNLNDEYEIKRSLEGANDEIGGRKTFVPPAPTHPTNYTEGGRPLTQPKWPAGEFNTKKQPAKSSGIFSKVMKAARSFQSGGERYEQEFEQDAHESGHENSHTKVKVGQSIETQDESLDIPAFLRRKN